ncbi:MAG: hypothetical protein ABH858_05145 [Candidatus Omnitrophota bacterium]
MVWKNEIKRVIFIHPMPYSLCPMLLLCAILLSNICFAASAGSSLKRGNSFYKEGKYDEALKNYNQAGIDLPDSDVVNFNKGAASYAKEDYEKALESFTKALLSNDRDIEEKAVYNIGNAKYRIGKRKENTDLSAAVNFCREALDYYKRAIDLNHSNKDAKFNHEFVERELKILLDKLKQQKEQEKQKQEGQKQEVGQGEKEKQEEQKQEGGREEKPATEVFSQEEKEKQEASASRGENEDERKDGPSDEIKGYNKEQDKRKEMSEDEARMILERYSQEELSPSDMDKSLRRRQYPDVLKDW